ncbi:MAG: peptide deformylase [Patescibacteria group bacterium]
MQKIVQKDAAVLRQIAKAVTRPEFNSPALKTLLRDMSASLAQEPDGIALAAPQIGVSKRVFIVSHKISGENNEKTEVRPDLVFINPVITKLSKKKKLLEEGCLSVRPIYGEVARAEKASVEAYDETGQKFTRHGSGLLAQIFQHEIDHLNGILFIDKAENLHEILPEELENS